LHIGSNLPPKDNLRKEDKSSAPKVQRFHCIVITTNMGTHTITLQFIILCRLVLKVSRVAV